MPVFLNVSIGMEAFVAFKIQMDGNIIFLPEWSMEPGSSIAACLNCFTLSYIGWTLHNASSINSESQFTGVCRIKLFSST